MTEAADHDGCALPDLFGIANCAQPCAQSLIEIESLDRGRDENEAIGVAENFDQRCARGTGKTRIHGSLEGFALNVDDDQHPVIHVAETM